MLDDYHVIAAPEVHAGVSALIERARTAFPGETARAARLNDDLCPSTSRRRDV